LITDGTDDHISAIDNSASRELQLSGSSLAAAHGADS